MMCRVMCRKTGSPMPKDPVLSSPMAVIVYAETSIISVLGEILGAGPTWVASSDLTDFVSATKSPEMAENSDICDCCGPVCAAKCDAESGGISC